MRGKVEKGGNADSPYVTGYTRSQECDQLSDDDLWLASTVQGMMDDLAKQIADAQNLLEVGDSDRTWVFRCMGCRDVLHIITGVIIYVKQCSVI